MQRSWFDQLPETHRSAIRNLFPDLRHRPVEDWHQAVCDYFLANSLSPFPSQTAVWRQFRSFERLERQREAYQIAGEVCAAGETEGLLEASERILLAELLFAAEEFRSEDLSPKDRTRALRDLAAAKNGLSNSRKTDLELKHKVEAKLTDLEKTRQKLDPETLRVVMEELIGIL
ncbi:hypothetical protein [Synechococcus sp. PCC 6312]|uniref:hypothetical protein n=1 Tax=Synechococcus sp. (strain ATCC 27167 / PCC 6312) TaxID=195253 RepID=UPI00029ED70F|nr:hypothetical protein [Synechococcus sp. PCC 6312]AFY60344.1 hypothetical protein Syn6312_1156 [Synechococcus sp. PCC 6312]